MGEHQRDFQRAQVGRRMSVLVEKPGREPGQMIGKTPWLHAAHLDAAPDTRGRLVEVEIVDSNPNSLAARAL